MTTDCLLNYKFNTWKFQDQTWGEHVVYRNCFWLSENFRTQHVLPMFCKKKSFWQRFTCTEVTNDSLISIIEYLKQTLWKLDVNRTKVDFSKLLELRSMPGLRILNCQHLSYEDIEKLRIQLPHLCISSSDKAGSKLRKLRQLLSTSSSS